MVRDYDFFSLVVRFLVMMLFPSTEGTVIAGSAPAYASVESDDSKHDNDKHYGSNY
jgi:hypothetical protein